MKSHSLLAVVCAVTTLVIPQFSHAAEQKESTGKVIDAYLEVQTALSKDNLTDAQKSAKAVEEAASLEEIKKAASEISGAKDIDAARKAFKTLSEKVIALAKENKGAAGKELYVAHCPMALGDGADWLQDTRKISNPYFGASMSGCGSVTDTVGQ